MTAAEFLKKYQGYESKGMQLLDHPPVSKNSLNGLPQEFQPANETESLSLEDVIVFNETLLAEAGAPETHHLYEQGLLGSIIERYNLESKSAETDQELLDAIAELCFEIAQGQTFADGNRRTAFKLTQWILQNNNLSFISPIENENEMMLPRYLNNLVETDKTGTGNSVEDFKELFRRRYENRIKPYIQ